MSVTTKDFEDVSVKQTNPAFRLYDNLELIPIRVTGCSLVAIFGLILNILAVGLILRFERPLTTQNRLILNMCANGLLLSGYALPFDMYKLQHPEDDLGWLCRCSGFIVLLAQGASFAAYLLVSLHRYFMVVARQSTILSFGGATRTTVIIGATWLFLSLILLSALFGVWGQLGYFPWTGLCTSYFEDEDDKLFGRLVLFLSFILPLFVMIYCYSHILFEVLRQKKKIFKTVVQEAGQGGRRKQLSKWKKEVHLAGISALIIGVYILTWLPNFLIFNVKVLSQNSVFWSISYVANKIHAVTDPLIYVLGDPRLRRHVRSALCGKCRDGSQVAPEVTAVTAHNEQTDTEKVLG